jgi:hypothetical protein
MLRLVRKHILGTMFMFPVMSRKTINRSVIRDQGLNATGSGGNHY